MHQESSQNPYQQNFQSQNSEFREVSKAGEEGGGVGGRVRAMPPMAPSNRESNSHEESHVEQKVVQGERGRGRAAQVQCS